MSALFVTLRIALVRIGFALGSLAGRRRRVLLATAHATRLGGNLAFLHAALVEHGGVETATLAHRTTAGWRGRMAGAVAAVRAGWAIARATVIVLDDYFFPLYVVRLADRRLVVQTWHASGAFKKFGHSLGEATFGADPALTARVRIHAGYDVCLVGSAESAPHFAEAFDVPIDRFRTDLGIPRTDLLFGDRAAAAEAAVRRRYGIGSGRRVVLFAPTFRGDRVTEARYEPPLDLAALQRQLGDGTLLLLRLHPFVRRSRQTHRPVTGQSIIDVSDHPDVNALMLVADVLVTDYSSAIFEFSLLERPMAFFAPDLADYERERGFYVDYRSWVPGPVFETAEDLAAWLRDGPVDLDRVRRFRERMFDVADGGASRRVVERILLPGLSGRPPIS